MPKTRFALVLALAFVLAACTKPPTPTLSLGGGQQFVPQIVDFLDNVGVDPSITLDSNGDPHLVYFGFVAKLNPGQLPVNHPIGSPTLPAVLDAYLTNGVWSHGKVVDGVKGLTPTDVTGTGVAADPAGKLHVVYSTTAGLWYADDTAGDFAPKQIVSKAVSGPSVAVDPKGVPWVAFYQGNTVQAGWLKGSRWTFETVANIGPCGNCPPLRTAIGFLGKGQPIVAYTDPKTKTPTAAVAAVGDKGWIASPIDAGVGGEGIAMAIDSKGLPHVSYYTDKGAVEVATAPGRKNPTDALIWNSSEAGQYGTSGTYPEGLSTSISMDDKGTNYVAWYDPGADNVQLASDRGGSFQTLPVRDTFGGSNPVVGVTPDGSSVYLGWYDHVNENLQLGTYTSAGQIQLAQPSPTPATPNQPTAAPSGVATCSVGPKSLDVTAQGTAFQQTCLAASAGKPFTITFNNQDPFPHNVQIATANPLTDPSAKTLFAPPNGATFTGPGTTHYDVKPQKPGTYFFYCVVHPTQMTGTFVVQK